jgi:transposase InsO family protein
MDFILGLPTTQKGHSIWVIVDRLTKIAHFLRVKIDYRPPQYAKKYIAEIVRLHGILKTIVSDRGSQFTAHFWEHLHKGLGTSLIRSTVYHPQIDGQTERVNVVLKDMLRAYVLSSRGSWESWLPLAEFAYNNSYQESIKMAPFEALYGRKCRTPLNWIEPGERRYYGIDFVKEAEKRVHIIQQNMKAAQSR